MRCAEDSRLTGDMKGEKRGTPGWSRESEIFFLGGDGAKLRCGQLREACCACHPGGCLALVHWSLPGEMLERGVPVQGSACLAGAFWVAPSASASGGSATAHQARVRRGTLR